MRDGLPVAGQYRASANSGAHLQSLLLATLVFTSLACGGIIVVSLVDHYIQPAVTPLIFGVRYVLVLLISASLSLLVHRRLNWDWELTWAYRTLGEGAEEREVKAVVDEVARIVTSTLDINDVYQQFGKELSRLVDCDRITVIVTDQDSGTMEFKYIYGLRLPTHIQGAVFPLDGTRTKVVVETRKTHVWEDTNTGQVFRTEKSLASLGLRAGITTPLVSKGKVFGVLNLRSTRVGVYGPWEQGIVRRMATQIAPAVKNVQLYEESLQIESELRQSEARIRALWEAAPQGIISTNESGEMVQVNDAALEIFGYCREELLGRSVDMLLPRDLRASHVNHRETYFSDPKTRSMGAGRELQGLRKDGNLVPLEIGLSFVPTESGTVALAFITDISQRKQAEEAERRWAGETEVLAEIGRVVTSSLDINDVYASLGEQTRKLLPFHHMSLSLIDHEKGVSYVTWVHGQDVPSRVPGDMVPLSGAFVNEVVIAGSPVVLTVDTEEDLLAQIPLQLPAFLVGMRSFLGVPLFFRDNLIGVLQLQSKEPTAYSQRDSELAERIANQISGAVTNSQLYAERARLANESAVMSEIGRVVSSSLDIDEVYQRLGDVIGQIIPFDQAALNLIDLEKKSVTPTWVMGTRVSQRGTGDALPLEGTLALGVAQAQSPILVTAENKDDLILRFPALIPHFNAGFRSFVCAPLVHRGDVKATLQLSSINKDSYAQRQLDLLERIAQQIAGAIANSQLYSERVLAEAAMTVSERKYRTLVNESPDMILVSRIDNFRFWEVNDRACEHYGYSSEEFLDLNIFDLEVEPPLKEQVRSMYDSTPIGQVLEVYGTNKRKDGTTFPVHVRFSKLDDEFAIANVRDITDQRAAEETQHRLDEENSVMVEIGKVINASQDINDVYEHLGDQIKKLIPFDRLSLTIINKDLVNSTPTWIIGIDVPTRRSRSTVSLAGSVAGEVLRTRLPSLLEGGIDSDLSERYPGLLPSLEVGLRSFISVPLIYRDEVIGILQLRSMELGAYSQRHLELAERIANQIAGAIANAQMYENLEDTASELAVGDRIADIMTSTADADQLYEKFSGEIKRLVDVDRISINRIDRDARSVTVIYVGGMDIPERHVGMTIPLEGTVTQFILDSGQTLLEETIGNRDQITADRSHLTKNFRSGISVPLRSEGQIMNTLHLQSTKDRAFGPNQVAIIERYADRIAPAIENARLDAEAHRQAIETAAMAEIGRTVSASLDINEVYEHLGEDIGGLIPFEQLIISLINNETQTSTPTWLFGTQVPGRQAGSKVPLAGALAGEVVRTRTSSLVELKTEDDVERSYPLLMPAYDAGLRTFLAVPLIDRDAVIGVLQIRSEKVEIYNNRHLELAERIANQIAGAIANSQLYAEHKRLAEENAVMAEIGRIISSSLDVNEVHERLGEAIRTIIPFDRLTVGIIDSHGPGGTTPVWVIGTNVPGRRVGDKVPTAGGPAEAVVQARSPRLLQPEGEAEVERDYPNLLPAYQAGLRSFMIVPLIDRDVAIGVLRVVSKNPGFYSQLHLDLAERIGNQIAGAIANSHLYVEHQRLAEENSVMADIARIIGSSLDTSDVYESVFNEMRKLVPVDRISTSLADLERGTLTSTYVSGIDVVGRKSQRVFPIATSFAGSSIISGSSQVCHPVNEDDLDGQRYNLRPSFRAGLSSMVTVQLVSSGATIGVMHLQSVTPNAYTSKVVDIVERIAALIAPSLEKTLLYDEQNRSLKEKEVLLQEINHRVKNNLQIISSLLNLQSRDIQDPQVLRAFRTGQDRIGAMAMVHEKLYQSEDLARIDFGEYIKSLAGNLINSYGLGARDIGLKIDVDNILLGVDTAIPCGVIVNELVANSLKHEFPGDRAGEIVVSFREVDGQYTMMFKDNGVGMSEDLDLDRPSSLGLTIVNALTGQLGGTIGMGCNDGCEVSITFPARSTNGNGH
jgi:PAS domain S-box-containing protein